MTRAQRPPLGLLLRELPYTLQIAASPLRRVRKIAPGAGQGQPVLVFPGILSSDQSTSLLRRSFAQAGFSVHASKLGFVTGVTGAKLAQGEARLADVYANERRKIVLLGWSLGGIYARVLAQRMPDTVSMVVTMGTPFSGDRHANNAWRLYNALNDHTVDAPSLPDDPSIKPQARTIAIWSANDGVIAPPCARGLDGERDVAVEVTHRHFALGSDRGAIASALEIVTDELVRNGASRPER